MRTTVPLSGKLERLFDAPDEPDPDSEEGAFFEALITLIQAYERKHCPIDPPEPIEASSSAWTRVAFPSRILEPLIGKSNRVYEVLNRTRPLTLAMIRRLHQSLGIPAHVLIAVGGRVMVLSRN